jgi:hypothetical protein
LDLLSGEECGFRLLASASLVRLISLDVVNLLVGINRFKCLLLFAGGKKMRLPQQMHPALRFL